MWRVFTLLEAVTSSSSSQIHFDWKILLTTPTWKLLATNLINYKVSPLWRNLGSNNNLTENQNKFQFPARNVLGKSFVNIKFWGVTFPSLLVTHWNTLISHHSL